MVRELSVPVRRDGLRHDSAARRGVDIVLSFVALVILSPVLLGLAVAVVLSSHGPAVYRQRRVGRGGNEFMIWKFRTMVVGADRLGAAVSGRADPRITRIGRWLRGTRLDELPQLMNVLRGDLTIIGPRPEVRQFTVFYTQAERRTLEVRPGVIGPGALLFAAVQSSELDDATDPDAHYVAHHLHPKLALDLAYLSDRGFVTDLSLVARAMLVMLRPSTPESGDD